jgi:CHAD domain-containing protein
MAKAPEIHIRRSSRKPRKEAAAAAAAGAAGAAAIGGKLAWDKLSHRQEDQREYRLHEGEFVPDGIRRIARGQLDYAREGLGKASDRKIGDAVHETRKSLKRLRALVRVARTPLGDDRYRKENGDFRECGKLLSAARDSKVLIETLDELNERSTDEIAPEATAALSSRLEQEHQQALDTLRGDDALVESVLARLTAARRRTARWTFEADGFDGLAPGLERVYRRTRKRMRAALNEPSTENLHEWRKRVKDFWHATQLVRPASPKRLKKLAKRAHNLSDLLGDDHDLAVLRDYVEAHPQCFPDEETRLAVQALIDRRRQALQQQAFVLGRRIFKQPPKRFTRRLERGWRDRTPETGQPALA